MRRIPDVCLLAGLIVLLHIASIPVSAQAGTIDGTYAFIQDSGGAKAPANVTYMVTLSDGKALLVSSPADEKFTDSGTYVFKEGVFTSFALPKLGRFARNAKGGLENGVLTLPIRLLSGGSGTSTWRALSSQQSAEQQESLDNLLDKIFRAYDRRVSPSAKGNLLFFGLTAKSDPAKLFKNGTAFNMAGHLPEAIWLLTMAAKQVQAPIVLNNLGHALSFDGEPEWARSVLLAARRTAPRNAMVLNNLAYADYQLKRYQEAEMAALRAVSIEPLPDFYWNLCKIVTAQRRYGDALKYCNAAKERGIQKILYPGKRGGGSKPSDTPGNDNQPPAPDAPPGPDGPPGESRGEDLKGPASNDDEAAENTPDADPEDSIIGQIGKRDRAGDQKPPKKPHFDYNSKPLKDLNPAAAEWVGHWEGDKVMGCINRLRDFGQGLATTKVHENLCHYAQKLSLDVDEKGRITGKGEAVYVIYDKADMVATMMMPIPLPPGGFFATFPGGYRVRDLEIEGVVKPDGTVYISGWPTKPMYLLNVYMLQKNYGWNVFPPPANDNAAEGVLQIGKRDGTWTMEAVRKNVISGMNYQTLIYKSDVKRNMAKGCRVYCEQQVELKDTAKGKVANVKCSLGPDPVKAETNLSSTSTSINAGPVTIRGNDEQISAEVDLKTVKAKAGANFGKPGDLEKLIKAQYAGSCMAPEKGINEKAGTESAELEINGLGISNERNPITGDETFSIGVQQKSAVTAANKQLKGEIKFGMRLMVNSRCGVGLRFNIGGSLSANKKMGEDEKREKKPDDVETEKEPEETLADKILEKTKPSFGCSADRGYEATVWASGTILE